MECELFKEYEESDYVLIMGKVLRLEVDDRYLTSDGTLDIRKAKPLMMIGSKKGMHFCTLADSERFESFGAMFPDGRYPLAAKYENSEKERKDKMTESKDHEHLHTHEHTHAHEHAHEHDGKAHNHEHSHTHSHEHSHSHSHEGAASGHNHTDSHDSHDHEHSEHGSETHQHKH